MINQIHANATGSAVHLNMVGQIKIQFVQLQCLFFEILYTDTAVSVKLLVSNKSVKK